MRALRHRTVGFLLVVGLLWAGSEVGLRLTAPGRIDPALARALARNAAVDVVVTLGFAPEDFHIRLFQGYGVVRGVRGATILLNRVRSDDVWWIARRYWVRKIALQ